MNLTTRKNRKFHVKKIKYFIETNSTELTNKFNHTSKQNN